jgi:hypothetical protein
MLKGWPCNPSCFGDDQIMNADTDKSLRGILRLSGILTQCAAVSRSCVVPGG